MMKTSDHLRTGAWLKLAVLLAVLAALTAGLILAAPLLPGVAGEVIRNNEQQDIRAGALFYSELTELAEFTAEGGKYFFQPAGDAADRGGDAVSSDGGERTQ